MPNAEMLQIMFATKKNSSGRIRIYERPRLVEMPPPIHGPGSDPSASRKPGG